MDLFVEGSLMFRLLILSSTIICSAALAYAQDSAMKVCGEKWQSAKAAGTTAGNNWPKFLAECRSGLSAAPAAKPDVKPASVPAKTPSQPILPSDPKGSPVLPAAVDAKFASLRPAQARQKTCSEQFQANKASDANAGLRWIQKGGGYWSLCNKKLKGA